jgi:hypothetical protein
MMKNIAANLKSCLKLIIIPIDGVPLIIMEATPQMTKKINGNSTPVLIYLFPLASRVISLPSNKMSAISGSQVKLTGIRPRVLSQSAKKTEKIMI